MPDFDYGSAKQARQVIPGRAQTFESKVNRSENNVSVSI
jgi:hypothetical protein